MFHIYNDVSQVCNKSPREASVSHGWLHFVGSFKQKYVLVSRSGLFIDVSVFLGTDIQRPSKVTLGGVDVSSVISVKENNIVVIGTSSGKLMVVNIETLEKTLFDIDPESALSALHWSSLHKTLFIGTRGGSVYSLSGCDLL